MPRIWYVANRVVLPEAIKTTDGRQLVFHVGDPERLLMAWSNLEGLRKFYGEGAKYFEVEEVEGERVS